MNPTHSRALILGATGATASAVKFVHWWRHRKDGDGVGYENGIPITVHLVTIDGKAVEITTAAAFLRMRRSAAESGVRLRIVSAFRTMTEQQYFYGCYIAGNCNGGNYAERPGHSEHQSGRALDLNTRAPGVHDWLLARARAYGFVATVPNEPWHWEYWGESPPLLG